MIPYCAFCRSDHYGKCPKAAADPRVAFRPDAPQQARQSPDLDRVGDVRPSPQPGPALSYFATGDRLVEALVDIRNRVLCPVGPSPTIDELQEIASAALEARYYASQATERVYGNSHTPLELGAEPNSVHLLAGRPGPGKSVFILYPLIALTFAFFLGAFTELLREALS